MRQTGCNKRLCLLGVGAVNVSKAHARKHTLGLIAFVRSKIVTFFDARRDS